MQEPDPSSLALLDESLARLEKRTNAPAPAASAGMGGALQSSLELVAGVAVGASIGLALDHWLGTSPFLLILCFFLGAAGGFMTLIRTSRGQSSPFDTEHTPPPTS